MTAVKCYGNGRCRYRQAYYVQTVYHSTNGGRNVITKSISSSCIASYIEKCGKAWVYTRHISQPVVGIDTLKLWDVYTKNGDSIGAVACQLASQLTIKPFMMSPMSLLSSYTVKYSYRSCNNHLRKKIPSIILVFSNFRCQLPHQWPHFLQSHSQTPPSPRKSIWCTLSDSLMGLMSLLVS